MDEYYTPDARWHTLPEYMREPVRRYVMEGAPVGSFLEALFSGARLTKVVGCADDENRKRLIEWAAFLYNDMPILSQGTPERFQTWMASGGINGLHRTRGEIADALGNIDLG